MSEEKKNLILDIENLVVRYETEAGVVQAINGIDMKLGYKQTMGLVGETGAGKPRRPWPCCVWCLTRREWWSATS